jgi:hypothetical protein
MTSTERPTLDEETQYYRVLWYADPGGGKTTNIAQAAKFGKVIYIDAENGLKGKALKAHGIPLANIEPYRDVTYEGLMKLYHEVMLRFADGEEVFAIAWDTTTKTNAQFLEDIATAEAGNTTKNGHVRTEFDQFLEDYGTSGSQMRRFLRRLHDLPCHVLLGAHQRRDQDDDTGQVTVGPAVPPAVATDINGYMDLIIHCRTEEFADDLDLTDGIEFSGLTRKVGRYTAKDRFGLTPKNMVDPGFHRVLRYLDDGMNKADDPLQRAARARRSKPEPTTNDGTEPALETTA